MLNLPIAAGQQKGAGGGTAPGVKGVDVDGEGQVNGINLYEFSLDTLRDEDKPWRKPGKKLANSLFKLARVCNVSVKHKQYHSCVP